VIATARTHPAELGLPFASWTMERLHTYLAEACDIPMGKTGMFELLQEEGLRWYKQEGGFGERVAPAFAQKRGPSNSSAGAPQLTVPS
jgi:transposase